MAETKEKRNDSPKYVNKLRSLHQHAIQLTQTKNIEEVAKYTLDAMEITLGFNYGSFAIIDDAYLNLAYTYGYEYIDPLNPIRLHLDGPGITVRAVKTGETQLVPDTRTDDDYLESERSVVESLSELDVPVKTGEEVVAILNVESTKLNAFTEEDKELLEILASHVASSIIRFRAEAEIRNLSYKLNNLKPGGCYMSDSQDRCLKAYAELTMHGVQGLCIVREDPGELVVDFGIKADEIRLLSSKSLRGFQALSDLQSVSRAISEFLRKGGGVVLLDGLEYLITRFEFNMVYSFIQEKRFEFLEANAVFLVPLDPVTLHERERALLRSELDALH